ncbi:MAG: hypothetical protein AMXMBFR64_44230 [Myxococcales bacterium]
MHFLRALTLAVVLLPALASAAEYPKWVRLSWSDPDSTSTMAITWNTDSGQGPTLVQYGETPALGLEASGTSFKANGELGHVHEVELWDLKPDTTYFYRAGAPSAWGEVYSFSTGPLPGCGPVRFVALGDGRSQDESGPAPQWSDIFADALGEAPDFVINTGDIVKEGTDTKQWRKWLQVSAPLLPQVVHMTSLGNHDDDKDDGDTAAYNQVFQLPRNDKTETEDFYWFRYGDAIFASLSTATYNEGTKPFEVQAAWLDEVLTQNPATWRFVFFHHPVYTSHANAFGLEFNHPPNELGQNAAFVPVFDKHHVDVVFMGHNHFYERFAPMKGGGGNPTGNPVGDPSLGTMYVITGGAGAFTYDKIDLGFVVIDPMQDVVCAGPSQAPGSQVCSGKHHYVTVSIDGGTMTAEVIATAAQNFTNDPSNIEVIDTFSITKAAPTPVGCEEEPGPVDDPDAGSTGDADGGSTDAGGEDAGSHPYDAGPGKDSVTPPAPDARTAGGDGADAPERGGGAGLGDLGDPGAGGGGGGTEGPDDKTPGATPGDPTGGGGGGISPVPTPNVGGSDSGASSGGCGAAPGAGSGLWFVLIVALVVWRSRKARRALLAMVLGVLPVGLDGCSAPEPPPEPSTPAARRRPPEAEDLPAPPVAPARTAPVAAGRSLPGRQVQIPTNGGPTLVASWLPAADAGAPLVVLLHQMKGSRAEWAAHVEALRDEVPASVLAVDLRGHGESTGDGLLAATMPGADWEALPTDVQAAMAWARKELGDPARPVAVVGADVSGTAALLGTLDDSHVKALAILSPGLSYHGLEALPAMERLGSRSVLLLAGAEDKYAAHSARVLAAAAPGTELRVVDGASAHGAWLLASPDELVAWLRQALGAP